MSRQRRPWKRKKDDDEDDNDRNQYPRHVVPQSVLAPKEKRSITSIVSAADTAELERHYTFLPPSNNNNNHHHHNSNTSHAHHSSSSLTWQQRMVQHYHQHLYKEFVIADFSRMMGPPAQYHCIGLRWRSRQEVEQGKGETTCGNKHCPSFQNNNHDGHDKIPPPFSISGSNNTSNNTRKNMSALATTPQEQWLEYYWKKQSNHFLSKQQQQQQHELEQEEWALLQTLPYGIGLYDYEVNFSYQEPEPSQPGTTATATTMVSKQELVKLRLCLKCAPLLFMKHVVVVVAAVTTPASADATNAEEKIRCRAAWAARNARCQSLPTTTSSSQSAKASATISQAALPLPERRRHDDNDREHLDQSSQDSRPSLDEAVDREWKRRKATNPS